MPFALDTLPECFDKEPNNDPAHAQKVKLPVIVNGRIDRPDDWDVFQFAGHAGDTIVAEVDARGGSIPRWIPCSSSPTPAGKLLAFNDDHEDPESGLNTHHADSYLMVKLPADGTYYVHLGDIARNGGEEYGYRLRISPPRPDFALRVVPSSVGLRSKSAAAAQRPRHPQGRLRRADQAGLERPAGRVHRRRPRRCREPKRRRGSR